MRVWPEAPPPILDIFVENLCVCLLYSHFHTEIPGCFEGILNVISITFSIDTRLFVIRGIR